MLGSCRSPFQHACDRFFHFFPCLSDPARRSSLCLKIALVLLHLFYGGVLVLFDEDLIEKTKRQPWYTALYAILFVATLAQYFFTSGSSPGYVLDAMRAATEEESLFRKTPVISKQPASSKNGSIIVSVDGNQLGRSLLGNATSWTKLVMDMYPPGSSVRNLTCTYCNVVQPPRAKHCHDCDRCVIQCQDPPRAKHCHDCDRCVIQFDHHCVWLGTCIGQGNHCRFWWYICEETTLCFWTVILYIEYLKTNIYEAWWIDVIMISLLATLIVSLIFLLLLLLFHSYLVLTNQTTYELVRRRRIPYLRGIPERVFPFSKGACRNLYNFCCGRSSIYSMEPLPTALELEEKSRPYTCFDVLSCRCCC